MSNDIIAGNWQQLKGQVLGRWGEITEDELTQMEGTYEELLGLVRKKYGLAKNKAVEEINDFLESGVLDNFAEKAERFVQNSIVGIKEKSHELQENVITYIQENPVKSIGIAWLLGILSAKILKD